LSNEKGKTLLIGKKSSEIIPQLGPDGIILILRKKQGEQRHGHSYFATVGRTFIYRSGAITD
jgi:hypothetical protein